MNQDIKILIVCDDVAFSKDLTLLLREESCDVYSAADGKSSLEMIRTLHPDIIFLNEILSDIHGSELCRSIKSDPAIGNIFVIMLSGSDQWSEYQADGQLEKDIPAWNLSARLKLFIRNRQLEKALQKKESEKLLSLGEAKFRAILDASPVPIALNDEKQNITYLNSSFIKTFGYDLNEIPDLSSWWPLAYPDPEYRQWVSDTWQEHLDKTKQEHSPFEAMELNIHCKDGTVKTALVEAVMLEGLSERVHLVSLFDITERKRAEESLQQASDIIKNMQIGQYVYELENPEDDRSLRLVAANPASGKLSGIAPEEQIGKYIDEIFPALRKMNIPRRFAEVVLTGKEGEFEDIY